MTAPARSRAAVLGRPVAHSLSPVLHRAAYDALGLDWTYEAIDCGTDELAGVLDRLGAAGYAGVSLTMPLKVAAVPLVDSLDRWGAALGAVNTVLFRDRGRSGHNTDVAGAVAALRELGVRELPGSGVAVLGAGGSARAVVAALRSLGVSALTVYARSVERAAGLVEAADRLDVSVRLRPWESAYDEVRRASLVVSTVPAGAADPLAADGWPAGTAVFDLLYAPWPTALGRAALEAGAPVVGGLPMLVAQAAEQVRLMTGLEPPVAAMRAAGEAALDG